MSNGEFLRQLGVRARLEHITSPAQREWKRTLELFNKTNQLNTGDRRYTEADLMGAIRNGAVLGVLFVEDRFTAYGLVGAAIIGDGIIEHMVISCRVMGTGADAAFLALAAEEAARPSKGGVRVRWKETEKNAPMRDLLERVGFTVSGGGVMTLEDRWPKVPDFVEVEADRGGRQR
jgi:FkbH-like protein